MNRRVLCCALAGLCAACGPEREAASPESDRPGAASSGRVGRLAIPRRIAVEPSELIRTRAAGRRVAAGPAHVRELAGGPREAVSAVVELGPRPSSTRTPGEDGLAPPRIVDLAAGDAGAADGAAAARPPTRATREPAPLPLEPMRQRETTSRDIRYLDVVQGLPSGGIYALHMDDLRRLWLETNGAGLVRYDGTSAVAWGEREGLGSDRVRAIAAGPAGSLWLATDRGAVLFDGRGFTRYGPDQGLPASQVNAVLVDGRGRAWVGSEGGLSRVDPGRVTTWTGASGLPGGAVLALLEDADGRLWIATGDGGLARFDGASFEVLAAEPLGARRVNALLEDPRGGV